MKRIAILPVDDRPVNYDAPRYLGRVAGFEILLPPREWLGNPWRSSRHAALVEWLTEATATADALVVSIDTLGYGGLIPSRQSDEPVAAVLSRLQGLRDLKSARPELPILGSSVILRIHRSNSAEEEKPYWALYGQRMFRLSFLEHKAECGETSPAEDAERRALRSEVPHEVYGDYRAGRGRNHAVNLAMLDWVADGIFDYLILPQDDTADFGWNIAEARRLQAAIVDRKLTDRAITYSGADEIGSLLLARCACRFAEFSPRVFPRYATERGAGVVTDYEDRPLGKLLEAHLAPLGGSVVTTPAEANLDLWFNSPERKQGNSESQWLVRQGGAAAIARFPAGAREWAAEVVARNAYRDTAAEMTTAASTRGDFVGSLLAALQSGRPTAIADVKFVNAADAGLCDALVSRPEIVRLAAYGGWNTAGNTLGCVLAQAVIWLTTQRKGETPAQRRAQLEFLFLRFVDDYLYQACERTRCMIEVLPTCGLAPTMERLPEKVVRRIEADVRDRLLVAAEALRATFVASGRVRDVRLDRIHLPWQRLFEVGFEVEIVLA